MRKMLLNITLIVVVASMTASFSSAEDSKTAGLPKTIRLSTHTLGSEGSMVGIALCEKLANDLGVGVKNLPFATDVARMKSIHHKESIAGMIATACFIDITSCSADFKDWKPAKWRLMWSGYPAYASIMVRGNSKIKTVSDCKGKKGAYVIGWEGGRKTLAGMLAFGGVSWNDIVPVPTGSYVKTLESVGDGNADFCLVSVTTPKVLELGAAANGIRILPLEPHGDTAAWERLWVEAPHYVPHRCDVGALKGLPTWIAVTYYFWVVRDDTAEDLVCTLAHSIHKTYPKFRKMASAGPGLGTDGLSLENTVNIDLWRNGPVPYHRGTIKFLKEIGAWTPEHEEYQKTALVAERAVQRVVTENASKK